MDTDNATAQVSTQSDTVETTTQVEAPETTQNLDSAQTDTQETESTETQDETTETSDSNESKAPFGSATEKFVVNGKTYEWDWPTTKKMAQLGFAGRKSMQEAAQLKTSHKNFYNELVSKAASDPDGLIEVLTGKPRSQAQSQANPQEQTQQKTDPRVLQLEKQIEQLTADREQRSVAEETQKIKQEWDTAKNSYPELKDEVLGELLFTQAKQLQYRQLESGVEGYTLEDAAFDVVQFYRSKKQEAAARQKQSLAAKQQKAPAVAKQGSSAQSTEQKFQTFDDVRKFAGII